MPAHEDRSRGDDKELEDDGPVEVLDDDDIAVLKSYVCLTPHALTRFFGGTFSTKAITRRP